MKLYHYDHCPFCIRVRMIIGWKGLNVEEEILANADEQSHYDLIGVKVVPILKKDDGSYMKESLDIVAYIDKHYGQPLLQPYYDLDILKTWLENAARSIRHLVHPRNIRIFKQDFPTQADCDYYENKKSKNIGSFQDAFENSAQYISEVASYLDSLKTILPEVIAPKEAKPSYNDILLFPVLRTISHVKGLLFPIEVYDYMERISQETRVPLLSEQAI